MSGRAGTAQRLVIVESPAKAKTIQKYLGAGYTVLASVGHIRDLPRTAAEVPEKYKNTAWAKTGVDVDGDFRALYIVPADKKKIVRELKAELQNADELLLATDEDREGEAISWHLLEVLQPKVPVRRMVFNEITSEAITAAAANTRDLDYHLVDAQETRRIVDRLYGYEVSPVLWRKVASGLSAGRVQSVALRLIVDRERERIAHVAAEYADVTGTFVPGDFGARLVSMDGSAVARGGDFDQQGRYTKSGTVLDLATAQALVAGLAGEQFAVTDVAERPGTKRPSAPFMTSTLQQAAGGRLRWSSDRTMRVAQSLYERGYITYMRTDSTNLSAQAINAAREQARALYGPEYVAAAPRRYDRKVKNAQEAHEAIRPSGDAFRTPGQVAGELNADELALYDLIWKRTVASQMADAKVSTTTIRLGATATVDGAARPVEFTASGTVVLFAGYQAAYAEVVDDDRSAESTAARLPKLAVGDVVSAAELIAALHSTSPPSRYSEASLIKSLEELGIGRPSTYSAIISTIVRRDYVWKKGSALVPSFLGMAVIQLLERHFAALVDYEFTKRVEEVLDEIARGERERLWALTSFYFGNQEMEFTGLASLIDKLGDIDARAVSSFPIAGSDIAVRVGKYGVYLQRESDEARANVRSDIAPDEMTAELATRLLEEQSSDRDLGHHPQTGLVVVVKVGRYGPYVQENLPEGAPAKAKPRTASLFKTMAPDTVTLDDAVRLLELPRVVGADPESGEEITAQNGRYGPYLKRGTDSRSIESEESLLTITLDEALAVFAQPKRGRGRAADPGRVLGDDPATGRPMVLKAGRFGPYVTDGETNATIPRAEDPETLTAERAAELLADKRSRPPAVKGTTRKTAVKKTAAKKTTAKTAAKKTTAKRTTAKTAAKQTTAKQATARKTATVRKTAASAPAAAVAPVEPANL